MLAVHEHEARPFLSALDDHDTQGPTLAHDDDVLRVLTLDERSWEEPDTAGAPLEEAPTSERGFNAADPETDQVLARYFGEVRQFALLSFAPCLAQALGNGAWTGGMLPLDRPVAASDVATRPKGVAKPVDPPRIGVGGPRH